MVNACPAESDPRPKVQSFVSDPEAVALAGLVVEGTDTLIDIVSEEIGRQHPESIIVKVDRDFLADENITFSRELASYIERRLQEGKSMNLLICGDIPVQGWNTMLERFKGKDLQVFYFAAACRQVPVCTRIRI